MPLSPAIALLLVALAAATASAETLGALLGSRGLAPPADIAPGLAETVHSPQVLDDGRDLLAVYSIGDGESSRRFATRFSRASGEWASAPIEWSQGDLPIEACRGGLALERFAAGFLAIAHINPSAECTIVLGEDLAVRAVLAGWPVAKLSDERLVYQRNQVHFASFHPVALAIHDSRGPADVPLYPRLPYQSARLAHIARMRQVYTDAWCNAHNHPCDPDLFDEQMVGKVAVGAGGDALAFAVALDNTAGWSDAERWGRLEPYRELRAALARWDDQGAPPDELFRALAAGLARAKNLGHEASVAEALAGEPALRDLIAAALTSRPAAGQDPRSWLVSLDPRWAEVATWRGLARAAAVADEFTELVYVYTDLARPDAIRYRELHRRDVEARFGAIPLRRLLEPDILRQIAGPPTHPR
jgi:hypothetical protein